MASNLGPDESRPNDSAVIPKAATPKAGARTAPPTASSAVKVVDSNELLDRGREIHIRHDGEVYRLRLTRQNKLILTK